jgi:2-polyprenyl-6-methoxyphenol hydroxylase-like FAD-dependent oxidoreductase
VIIDGYGPVGQVLANLLGRAGHCVAVIERYSAFYAMPRTVHFDHEVARIFQSLGLRPDESSAIEPYDAMYAWRKADRKNLQLVDWTGVGPTGWHTSNFFTQPLLEPQLDQPARAHPTVSVQRGWEMVAVEDEPDQPLTVVVEGTDGFIRNGERRTLTARYVIGADGANWTTTALAGDISRAHRRPDSRTRAPVVMPGAGGSSLHPRQRQRDAVMVRATLHRSPTRQHDGTWPSGQVVR